MILGIGVDLLNTKRVEELFLKFSQKFAKKILSNIEFQEFQNINKNQVNYLAKRFCAKEAFSKALGTGIARGINFSDITIEKDKLGKPCILLSDKGKEFLVNHYKVEANKIKIDLSMTDEDPFVNCFVVMSS